MGRDVHPIDSNARPNVRHDIMSINIELHSKKLNTMETI